MEYDFIVHPKITATMMMMMTKLRIVFDALKCHAFAKFLPKAKATFMWKRRREILLLYSFIWKYVFRGRRRLCIIILSLLSCAVCTVCRKRERHFHAISLSCYSICARIRAVAKCQRYGLSVWTVPIIHRFDRLALVLRVWLQRLFWIGFHHLRCYSKYANNWMANETIVLVCCVQCINMKDLNLRRCLSAYIR